MTTLAHRLQIALSALDPPRSQADLARACGLKGPSVSNWFTGATRTLKGNSAILAAGFLGVRPKWLIDGTGPMRHSSIGDPTPHAPAAHPLALAEALPVVLGRLPGLDEYTAGKVRHAIQSAMRPDADIKRIERDLLQWLAAPSVPRALALPAQFETRDILPDPARKP